MHASERETELTTTVVQVGERAESTSNATTRRLEKQLYSVGVFRWARIFAVAFRVKPGNCDGLHTGPQSTRL